MDKLLIVGGDSVLGTALGVALEPRMEVWRTSRRGEWPGERWIHLDLAASVDGAILPKGPGVAVLCAGICSLQRCEQEPQATWHINVEQMCAWAEALHRKSWQLFFLSTNLVFSGEKPFPSPSCQPCPSTAYGKQKWAVEQRILDMQRRAAVVRLTKIVQTRLPIAVEWERAWRSGMAARAFHDMHVAPVHVEDFCQIMEQLLRRKAGGIWHISSGDQCSYARFATLTAQANGLGGAEVEACSAEGHVDALFRPAHVTLESAATWQLCGMAPPSVQDCISRRLLEKRL